MNHRQLAVGEIDQRRGIFKGGKKKVINTNHL